TNEAFRGCRDNTPRLTISWSLCNRQLFMHVARRFPRSRGPVVHGDHVRSGLALWCRSTTCCGSAPRELAPEHREKSGNPSPAALPCKNEGAVVPERDGLALGLADRRGVYA